MPPKAASKKAAPAAAAKKAATTTKKTAAAPAKAAAKPAAKPAKTTKAAAKPTVNGTTTATKKRKADEEEEDDDKENIPKTKKAKTAVTKEAPKKAAATKKAAAAPKKAAPAAKAKAAPKKAAAKKTKADEEEEESEEEAKPKKAAPKKKATPAPRARTPAVRAPPRHPHTIGTKINDAPTKILDIYVFGEGTSGELGLGSKRVDNKKPIDVKRPRLNANLDADSVGIVQISAGGMHVAAITHDNKILTWGVNDQGALGRDTQWSGGLRDADADSDSGSDDDDTGMNPVESTPGVVSAEHFAAGAKFVQVVTGDSATFVLTEDGRVYGWGTFRSSDGILGFSSKVQVQKYPAYLSDLKNIKALAAGSNHILALDAKGNILAWGCGQQNQLGRRIIERNKMSSLTPQGMALATKKIAKIACGQYHSFAVDTDGKVWTWGLNNFGETGIREGAGEDGAVILRPLLVEALDDYKITDIAGGQHHSLACSEDGKLLTWGRFDGFQVGLAESDVNKDDLIRDEHDKARILAVPTVVPTVQNVSHVSAGTDNSFAVTTDGKAYSWGFSANYQTGQGTDDDIEAPTLIDNTAVRGKKLVWAGAGGQYSVLAGEASP
ncbi:GDP/GTP exchange factor [Plectosphaerella plurivora]|uniref:GDP/GTP exchange factor n=1 Tax=Plectosphaerella plurivora TaxID=936078 RepID=A0A9P9AEU1_9PEZI|nr:GDP/GTP exchange factor [Plectosphaerella plurivora]